MYAVPKLRAVTSSIADGQCALYPADFVLGQRLLLSVRPYDQEATWELVRLQSHRSPCRQGAIDGETQIGELFALALTILRYCCATSTARAIYRLRALSRRI